MRYRKFGTSDLNLSVIGFGAWGIGGFPFWKNEGDEKSRKSILTAYENGINFFDTAPVYGFGHSEKLIGETLKPYRENVIIATKCGLRWDREDVASIKRDSTPKSIEAEIDASLKRLQTDWIDIYQVHWPDPNTKLEETVAELSKIRDTGKIRYIGVSNFSLDQLETATQFAEISSLQNEYNLLQRSMENRVFDFCKSNAVSVIAYSPLASGVLTGKYSANSRFTDWRANSKSGKFVGKKFVENMRKVDQLKAISERLGRSCSEIALNFVINSPVVVSAIVGVKNENQLCQNLNAANWNLTDLDLEEIEKIFA